MIIRGFFYIRKQRDDGRGAHKCSCKKIPEKHVWQHEPFCQSTPPDRKQIQVSVTGQTRAVSTPLLSLLRPKTEVRSQVNIPPSRCLQHASGQTRRDLRVPLISRCLGLCPSPVLELLPQLSAQFRLSRANQWDISARWESHFLKKKGEKNRPDSQ